MIGNTEYCDRDLLKGGRSKSIAHKGINLYGYSMNWEKNNMAEQAKGHVALNKVTRPYRSLNSTLSPEKPLKAKAKGTWASLYFRKITLIARWRVDLKRFKSRSQEIKWKLLPLEDQVSLKNRVINDKHILSNYV